MGKGTETRILKNAPRRNPFKLVYSSVRYEAFHRSYAQACNRSLPS